MFHRQQSQRSLTLATAFFSLPCPSPSPHPLPSLARSLALFPFSLARSLALVPFSLTRSFALALFPATYIAQAGGVPTIEQLQTHKDDAVATKAYNMIVQFFNGEDVENVHPTAPESYVCKGARRGEGL